MKNILKHLITVPAVIFATTNNGYSQLQETYEFPDDVKNHSIERLKPSSNTGPITNQSMYAGTIFRNLNTCEAEGSIHILSRHNLGGTWEYDHPDYDDERSMAITSDNADNASDPLYYIVSLVRPDPAGTLPFTNRDMIKILRTDDLGPASTLTDNGGNAVLREATIYESTNTASATFGSSLYPTDVLYSTLSGKKLIYICGYYVKGNTRTYSSDQPDHTDPKEAFILSFNVDPLSTGNFWNVEGFVFWDYTTNLKPLSGVDYDMPLRMTENNGRIWVTGATNALTYAGPTSFQFRSATMNITFDPDLNAATPVLSDKPFINLGNGNGAGWNEFGTAFYDDPNFSGNAKFIAGNFFLNEEECGTYGPGHARHPYLFHLTRLDANYDAVPPLVNNNRIIGIGSTSGAVAENAIISEILPSDVAPNNSATDTRLILTGINRGYTNCIASTAGNSPFVYDFNFTHTGALAPSIPAVPSHLFIDYPTAAGTGTGNNSYERLGGAFTSVSMLPVLFQRDPALNGDIVFSAPREINGKLGLKLFEGDGAATNIYEANCPYETACTPGSSAQVVEDPQVTPIYPIHTLASRVDGSPSSFMNNYAALSYEDCTNSTKQGTTGITPAIRKAKTVIYPNPASDKVQLILAKDIADEAHLQVTISDIQGRNVGVLYDGKAGNATQSMKLPELPNGLYMVQVLANGATVYTNKLQIEH